MTEKQKPWEEEKKFVGLNQQCRQSIFKTKEHLTGPSNILVRGYYRNNYQNILLSISARILDLSDSNCPASHTTLPQQQLLKPPKRQLKIFFLSYKSEEICEAILKKDLLKKNRFFTKMLNFIES
jgi:hypothetical protein